MSDEIVPTPPPAPVPEVAEDKTNAILAYLTPLLCGVGFVISILMHNSKKTKLGAFHLRQSLGLLITSIASMGIGLIPVLGWILSPIIGLAIFVLWILGIVSAVNGQLKPVPAVGDLFQKWFATLFE